MKLIKKILFFISLFFLYIIFKEFLNLYSQMKSIHPYAGYAILILLGGIFIYFVILPVLKIIKIPKTYGPTKDKNKEESLISNRIKKFKENKYLKSIDFDFSEITNNKDGYNKIIKELEKEVNRLRKIHISQIFYSTSIAQNGFLDAILILSGSINHIKEIFILFNGRVSNRDLINIAKKVYYSIAIGGSEGVEYATEEIISKFASQGMKSIPFIDKILSSIADGLVNATLLTRISYITENYCKLTYIKSDKDIYPSAKFIINSVKHITWDMIERIFKTLRKLAFKFALNKTFDFALIAVNPVGYVLGKTIERSDKLDEEKKNRLKEHAKLVGNPFAYGLEKLFKSLKKK